MVFETTKTSDALLFKKQVDLDLIDTQQLEKLKEFKKASETKGYKSNIRMLMSLK
ncbi:hypothetical protein IU399_14130 [Salmonella enterica subsp. enterica serovar Worthington]|nr:hypothetical protein [Salmonella enterica subsp. enterica serovar Worthington]